MGNCQGQGSTTMISNPAQFQGMRIICKSWTKTYNNLYDYVSKTDILIHTLTIQKSTKMIKNKGKYNIMKIDQDLPATGVDSALDLIDNKDGSFLYKSWMIGQNQNQKENDKLIRHLPWLVVQTIPSGKYAIKEGDIIRLGKQKVKVKEIILKDKEQEQDLDETIVTKYKIYNDLAKQAPQQSHQPQKQQPSQCRVCLDEGQPNNPLICPCKCTGSAKYIHLSCIQQWLTKSINPRQVNMATIITWKPLICQLCNTPLPFKIYLDGKKYFTVKIPRPKKPYIVLNPVYKDQNKVKVYYLISFNQKKQQIMGRKKDCDIKVSDDASVSRHHTIFSYVENNKKGRFFIQDNNSKYGTLIYLKKNLLIKPSLSGISLQIGGDLIQFQFNQSLIKSSKNMIEQVQLLNQSQSTSSQQEQSQQGQGQIQNNPVSNPNININNQNQNQNDGQSQNPNLLNVQIQQTNQNNNNNNGNYNNQNSRPTERIIK